MMQENGALLLYGSSYEEPDLYYATNFLVSDNVLYLHTDEKEILVTSEMEKKRAQEESAVDEVLTAKDLGLKDELGDLRGSERKARIIQELMQRYSLTELNVTEDLPAGIYKELDEEAVKVVEGPFGEQRATKRDNEIEKIREAQAAAAASMEKVRGVLEASEVDGDELLYEGEALTQGKLKKIVLHELLARNCGSEGLIVSSGEESSYPHKTGTEDKVIEAETPVIVDIFPFQKKKRYHGDMTRTFVKGEVPEEIADMHRVVVESQRSALELLEPGIKASKVDKAVCEFLEDKGYSTRLDESKEAEFKHSTGHGVGLEVHEKPHVGKGSDYELKPGNVVTIEPGLYNREGGVRVEDVAVIREDGAEVIEPTDRSLEV